jgi:hypothetical protein
MLLPLWLCGDNSCLACASNQATLILTGCGGEGCLQDGLGSSVEAEQHSRLPAQLAAAEVGNCTYARFVK